MPDDVQATDPKEALRKAVGQLHRWDVSQGWAVFNAILADIDAALAPSQPDDSSGQRGYDPDLLGRLAVREALTTQVASRIAPLILEGVLELRYMRGRLTKVTVDDIAMLLAAVLRVSSDTAGPGTAAELARLLAERERLIAAGADPAELLVPIPSEGSSDAP